MEIKQAHQKESTLISLFIVLIGCTVVIMLSVMLANGLGLGHLSGKTKQIVIQQRVFYAVQTGAYSDEQTARNEGEALKIRGGGGYVINDSVFRVIAAVYQNKRDAELIAANLTAQGTNSVVYTIEVPLRRINLDITTSQKTAIIKAAEALPEAYDLLYSLSVKLDTSEISVAEAASKVKEFRDGVALRLSGLQEISNITSVTLKANLAALINGLDNVCDLSLTGLEMSVGFKYEYTKIVCAYKNFALDG